MLKRLTCAIAHRPELEYLKAVNNIAPPRNPELLLLLMTQYINANKQAEGVAFFSDRLEQFGPQLSHVQKALYISAIALLRAQHARSVGLLERVGYVKDTLKMLDEASELSGGHVFVVTWISGVVRAQLPGIFHQKERAQEELSWCLENAAQAPDAGWLREVYFQLGRLALNAGEKDKAQQHLQRSGYTDFDKPITLTTSYSEDPSNGHTFYPRRIAEIVPGRVFALSGFEFTEYFFVVSDDGQQLISIDAGTRPDSAKAAYEALRAYAPKLPELTTIFITHSHWDHVGGHPYFHSLNPKMHIYARSNYNDELEQELKSPESLGKSFFGDHFSFENVRNFKPDTTIDSRTEVTIGKTKFELIPVRGGETHDAMFINLPDQGVMFVGDFIMPYLGAPFVEEGDLQGLLDAIDIVAEKKPKHILHGHEPITRNFATTDMLVQLKGDLGWLREQVLSAIHRGDENAVVQQSNLIPPDLLGGNPDVHLPYLLMREHVIDRLYHQNKGYWDANLQGVNHISQVEYGELLFDYLELSDQQLMKTLKRLVNDGRYELAAMLIDAAKSRVKLNESLAETERLVYLKLMEKYQIIDPFKFILYSGRIQERVPQMASPQGQK